MSVVNQMLLDIDRRRAEAGVDANPNAEIRGVGSHLPTTPAARSAMRPAARLPLAATVAIATAVLVLICLAAAGIWWLTRTTPSTAIAVAPPLPSTQRQPPAAIPGAGASAAVAIDTPRVVATSDATATPQTISSAMAAASAIDATTTARPEPPSGTADAKLTGADKPAMKLSVKLSASLAASPVTSPVTSPAASPAPIRSVYSPSVPPSVPPAAPPQPGTTTITTVPSSVPIRQVAADETVRVARALWADGSRSAATATLREALSSAESARNNNATAALARELARLEVADNRAQAALDLLRRLESVLADDVDAWALRGNAEQRLGLHTEAAESYLAALRARPTEGKWMIGAAISLAASGKTDEARIWVERARERGAVTPTIASYLQQLGISTRP